MPGECVLLFSPGDAVKQTSFIDEKPNPQERQIAREQLQQMVHYAECGNCRRSELLAYFGEEFSTDGCGACDNCLSPRATFDGTLAAQKFLSCVYRIREKNGFGVGLNHVVEVLTGADTEKIRKWGDAQLSTYGIGKEHSRPEWAAIGRELIRLGFLRQTAEKFSVLEITNEGRAALKERKKITLTKPVAAPETKVRHVGEITCDEGLFERLRELRKRLGFRGVTITDALEAGALRPFGSIGHRSQLAAQAGMDLLLCSGQSASEGQQAADALENGYRDGHLGHQAFRGSVTRILELRTSLAS